MLRLNAVIHFLFVLDKKSQSDFFQKRPLMATVLFYVCPCQVC